ncbi:3'(2'),5'-bisphosphate nucleotidase CysQ [Thalassocella blandensis]|nr:3'(2'),5'-bisphosphate nucleotidase CysQ [Thalassocella blandensis]
MSDIDYRSEEFITQFTQICEKAGEAILEVYHQKGDLDIQNKEDNSPLTEADMRSNAILSEALQLAFPEIPIISEELELASFDERKHWPKYWLIDPLDGTKEFIHGSGEFTVNVALIENHEPVFGVVSAPYLNSTYVGIEGKGAFKIENGKREEIHVRSVQKQIAEFGEVDVVASKRHGNDKVTVFLQKVEQQLAKANTKNIGSSLKICLLAEGKADFYPRLAPTCEWDIAAAHAVLMAAGGEIYHPQGERFTYNSKEEILNGYFFAVADKTYDWQNIFVMHEE